MKNLILSTILLLAIGCFSEKYSPEVAKLVQETEDIHDIAMKDLSELNKLKRSLKNQIGGEVLTKNPQPDSVLHAIKVLSLASDDMFKWMANYEKPDSKLPENEQIAYIKEQNRLILKNSSDIKNAISNGKKWKLEAAK